MTTELWHQAARALRANWLRAMLTALGVVIGVASLVDLTAVSAGAQAGVADNLRRLGPNIVIVDGEIITTGGNLTASDRTITPADLQAIARLPVVTAVAPHHSIDQAVALGGATVSTRVVGITPTYEAIHNYTVTQGRPITAADERFGSSVIVLGQKPAAKLASSPAATIGRTVRIQEREFTVVGVLDRKGRLGQDDLDNQVFVPLSLATQVLLGGSNVRSVDVRVRSDREIQSAQDQMTALLRRQHSLPSSSPDDFSMEDQASIVKTAQSATGIFRALTLALGAIALLVGGIGIMNIMLVSVTERTREIGIRKAVGADPRSIRRQFLIEAVMLSVLGGGVGVAVGIASAQLVAQTAGWRTVVTPAPVLIAFGAAVAIGLFFGYYPARRAAELDPLEALRHE
ncbi:MAG TPA: ABC transporter permease [Solirubrobacteraceae bacterium]|nr:ABC transporter permease [Solirubrobacteraceae bacterium]